MKEIQPISTNNIQCICIAIGEPIIKWGPSWSWSYGSWINNYLCNQCISPLTFFFNLNPAHDDTTLFDKVCLSQMTTDMFHLS